MIYRCLLLILLALTAFGCRPKGEVVRYMARPPASVTRAPESGTYLLYPGTNQPPILAEDLREGDPVGFTLQKTPAGSRLFAVVGEDRSLILERGERYAWMLQHRMNRQSMPDGDGGGTAADQRLLAARRGYEAARQQYEAARQTLEAAQRRLEEAEKP